ncbi:MAG TPA: hypothetical protein VMW87_14430 [Spirochaetia bacterium]|nr:hypothetical protein [Spirochaetia bacterium]
MKESALISRQYGPLSVLEREPAGKDPEKTLTIVLAHGFGANGWDVSPIADSIDEERRFRWLFPHAPMSLAAAAGQPEITNDDFRQEIGRAWFPRTTEELKRALFGDFFAHIAEQAPATLHSAGEELLSMIAAARGVASLADVVIGGFSQGAMTAIESILTADDTPAALLVLSGNPIDERRWSELFRNYPQRHENCTVRYFQSHGTGDPILSYAEARRLNEMLSSAGMAGEFHSFPGGHGIPEQILLALSEFLFTI